MASSSCLSSPQVQISTAGHEIMEQASNLEIPTQPNNSPKPNPTYEMSDESFEAHIEEIIMKLKAQGFGPTSSIHSQQAVHFYTSVLGANNKATDLLINGYRPHFKDQIPRQAEFNNNKTARKHSTFIQDKTEKWLTQGIVSSTPSKPWVINPLSVPEKISATTGEVKLRQCLDLSRVVNPLLAKEHTAMDDIKTVLPRVKENSWMVAVDLKQMYTHLRIHPFFRSFFGFALPSASGDRDYYIFNALPFGTG